MADCGAAMDDRQPPHRDSRPKIETISVEQAASFALLRRGQIESDRLPEDRGDRLDEGPMGQRRGLNSALARRAATQIGDVWIVPGNGYLALVVAGGAVCTETGFVVTQGTMSWTSHNGQGIVHGLVPDGVTEVMLLDSKDASVSMLVKDNVYRAKLAAPFQALQFTGPAGQVELGPYR
jgi:hypothetical protein